MTAYILIIYIGGGYGGGPATAEFTSFEACQFAASAVEAKWDGLIRGVDTLCVPKGSKL